MIKTLKGQYQDQYCLMSSLRTWMMEVSLPYGNAGQGPTLAKFEELNICTRYVNMSIIQ